MEGINEGMGPGIEGNNASELHFHPGSFSSSSPANDWSRLKIHEDGSLQTSGWSSLCLTFSDYSQGQ